MRERGLLRAVSSLERFIFVAQTGLGRDQLHNVGLITRRQIRATAAVRLPFVANSLALVAAFVGAAGALRVRSLGALSSRRNSE
jgi:hypothetical protein